MVYVHVTARAHAWRDLSLSSFQESSIGCSPKAISRVSATRHDQKAHATVEVHHEFSERGHVTSSYTSPKN